MLNIKFCFINLQCFELLAGPNVLVVHCTNRDSSKQDQYTMTFAACMATRAATGTERRARPAKGLKKSME